MSSDWITGTSLPLFGTNNSPTVSLPRSAFRCGGKITGNYIEQ
jgi:hypothetical protein